MSNSSPDIAAKPVAKRVDRGIPHEGREIVNASAAIEKSALPKINLAALVLPTEKFSNGWLGERAAAINREYRPKIKEGRIIDDTPYGPKSVQINPHKMMLEMLGTSPAGNRCSPALKATIAMIHNEFREFVSRPDFTDKLQAARAGFTGPLQPGELQACALALFAIEQRRLDLKSLPTPRRLMPIATLELLQSLSDPKFTGDSVVSEQWRAAGRYIDALVTAIYERPKTMPYSLSQLAAFGLSRNVWPAANMARMMELVLEDGAKPRG